MWRRLDSLWNVLCAIERRRWLVLLAAVGVLVIGGVWFWVIATMTVGWIGLDVSITCRREREIAAARLLRGIEHLTTARTRSLLTADELARYEWIDCTELGDSEPMVMRGRPR